MKKIDLIQNPYFKLFKTISSIAHTEHQSVYIVGGFVRDLIMKRGLPTDIDFVTEGSGIELAQKISQKIDPKIKVSVFKNFGTAMFRYKNAELEFVGARKESYSENSRKPAVETGSIEDDQKRRDFTINAMAISLNPSNFGELIDPFNGLKAIEDKLLITPLEPRQTYSDDPLRMMRAIRFATILGFDIEEKSFQAIITEAERIQIVSMERIMVEFNKIMMAKKPSIGLHLLHKAGLLEYILPELLALKGVEEIDGQRHKDNFYHTLEVVDNIALHTDNLWLRWAALLHDIGKAPTKKFVEGTGWTFHGHEFLGSKMVKKIFHRLKLPLGADMAFVQKMVKLSSRPIALITDDASDSALRRMLFDAGDDIEKLFVLCKADITTKNSAKQKKFQKNFEYVEQKLKDLEERDKIRNFQPPISGDEIMQLFDIRPGREIGMLKEAVKEAILEGIIPNEPTEARKFVITEAEKLGLKTV
ncbi:CCA tRNA nucleotidyltransferase [Bergeyella zoohelcum]|uniref:HD/PDEase domain-containing protein n=1 Tax=Bergeyella zoohelcum ATCC 43767 TaxID=883096 RepID=K1M0H8_9FLAO|nr:HD domain-containing protein [Bergeyella zoohelcum]EKB55828.1 hypothetical protein HMPREF9699_01473 [Bergeyella zoohelcum ATCC 43767]SUV48339.1 Multifunctional CCA protein [Bergeyella zoohelcum]